MDTSSGDIVELTAAALRRRPREVSGFIESLRDQAYELEGSRRETIVDMIQERLQRDRGAGDGGFWGEALAELQAAGR